MISLCGAGCGSYELMTLKALQAVSKADCILYDRLLDPHILSFAKPDCECIYVGKQARHHAYSQEEINALLIEKGRQYAHVVRLKGGDPCVFGRVGEEAQTLLQAGLPFEIIPGISSGIGGLAYAGIVVTHRDYCSGVRLMSAHGKKDQAVDLDYESMAHTRDTLIFYMGLHELSTIVTKLLEAGKPAHTPIALVSKASRKDQAVVQATLATILDVDKKAIVSPALIVVGEVLALRQQLDFQSRLPLYQKHYLLPQFVGSEKALETEIAELGADVERVDCGEILPNEQLLAQVDIEQQDVFVFSSRNAITIFFDQLRQQGRDVRSLASVKLAVLGKKSAQVLERYGVRADIMSEIADSEHLAQQLLACLPQGSRIALIKAENDNHALQTALQETMKVCVAAAYRCSKRPVLLQRTSYDGILFTCSFHVHALLPQLTALPNYQHIPVYSMGSHTSRALQDHGFQHIIQLPHADLRLFGAAILKEEQQHV